MNSPSPTGPSSANSGKGKVHPGHSTDPCTVTHSDIAKRAGVHRTTVSMALRNDSRLASSTRLRIQEIAKSMGFQPNPLINALMTQVRTRRKPDYKGTLAVFNPWPKREGWKQWDCFVRCMEGARNRASERGFELEEFWTADPKLPLTRLKGILTARNVGGIFLLPFAKTTDHFDFDFNSFAISTIGFSLKDARIPRACNHHFNSLKLLWAKLEEKGYKRILLVLAHGHDTRCEGAWSAAYYLLQQRLPNSRRLPIAWMPDRLWPARLLAHIRQHRPDAIITSFKEIIPCLAAQGFQVPEQLGVALLERDRGDVQVAGVDHNQERVGAAAIDMVINQVLENRLGYPECPHTTLIPGIWVDGASLEKQ